jgi:hypothetical protein
LVAAEQDMMRRLKESRDDQLALLLGSQEQKETLEQIKQDKVQGELALFKAQFYSVERKVDEEVAARVRNEDDIRKWFE